MEFFSERENKIITIIGRKTMTIEEIAIELFKNTKDKPFDTSIVVSNSIRRIISKCKFYSLDWTLNKSRKNNRLFIKKEMK